MIVNFCDESESVGAYSDTFLPSSALYFQKRATSQILRIEELALDFVAGEDAELGRLSEEVLGQLVPEAADDLGSQLLLKNQFAPQVIQVQLQLPQLLLVARPQVRHQVVFSRILSRVELTL